MQILVDHISLQNVQLRYGAGQNARRDTPGPCTKLCYQAEPDTKPTLCSRVEDILAAFGNPTQQGGTVWSKVGHVGPLCWSATH